MEACCAVVVLLFALLFITVIGHALWVMGAAVFRAMDLPGGASSPRAASERDDPHPQPYATRQIREIDGATRQIDWLAHTGRLSREAGDAALRALAARQLELQQQLDARLGRAKPAERGEAAW